MISINFKNENKESVTLQSTEDEPKDLLDAVEDYIEEINEDIEEGEITKNTPLANKEPETILIDFITWLLGDQATIEENYSIVKTASNNHMTYDLKNNQWKKPQRQ